MGLILGLGACKRQPIDVSLLHYCLYLSIFLSLSQSLPFSKTNKNMFFKISNSSYSNLWNHLSLKLITEYPFAFFTSKFIKHLSARSGLFPLIHKYSEYFWGWDMYLVLFSLFLKKGKLEIKFLLLGYKISWWHLAVLSASHVSTLIVFLC